MNSNLDFQLALLLKSSALLLLALAVLLLLRRTEPRWRVLVSRAAMLALPLLLAASLLAPVVAVSLFSPSPRADDGLAVDQWAGEIGLLPSVVVNHAAQPASAVAGKSGANSIPWVLLAWAGVAILLAVPQLRRLWLVRREARAAKAAPVELLRRWESVCSEFGIASAPDVRLASGRRSPFLVGGRAPLLVVPEGWIARASSADIDHVLCHEAAHVSSGDATWLPLARLLACALWFQPLSWILHLLHLRACEESADAAAARRGGADSYRQTLARMALELVPVENSVAPAFLRVPSVVGRLRVVSRHVALRPPSRWLGAMAAGAVLLVGLVFGNVGLAKKKESDEDAKVRAEAALALRIESINLQDATLADAIKTLQAKVDSLAASDPELLGSKRFPYRLKIDDSIDRSTRLTLKLKNVPLADALSYVGNLAGAEYRIEKRKIILGKASPPKRAVDLARVENGWERPPSEGLEKNVEKLKNLVIDELEFRDKSLADVADWLTGASARAEGEGKSGIAITLDESANSDTRITLKLTNVPLVEALRYVCKLAGAEFRVGEGGVTIRAKTKPAGELYTVVYVAPPGSFTGKDGEKRDAKKVLEEQGVTFEEGATSVYNWETGQLIVRNTEDQNDIVEAWIESLSGRDKPAAAKPAATTNFGAAQPDPSDVWYRGYLLMKEADESSNLGRFEEARDLYRKARELYRSLQTGAPSFHPSIIAHRIEYVHKRIEALADASDAPKPTIRTTPDRETLSAEELGDSLLEIRGATCEWVEDESDGERRVLTIRIGSDRPEEIDVRKVDLVVNFYEIIGDDQLEASVAETEIRFPSAPYDWNGEDGTEYLEVDYFLKKEIMERDGRRYYGFVAELHYDDVLQYVTASPSKLLRIAP